MIEFNKNRAGRLWNIGFGVSTLLDGLVRIASLGFLHTNFPVSMAKWGAKLSFNKLKK